MAVQRNFTENIEITPRELENELWNMNATEQTDFLLALSQRYENEHFNVVMQYEYIKDTMRSILTEEDRRDVVNMLKTLVEYLEEADTAESEE